MKKLKPALGILGLLIVAALPPLTGFNKFLLTFVSTTLIFVMYSSAWNLLAFSGQGSLGHAAFLGVGAYASALLAGKLGVPPLATIFFGGLLASLLGLFVGLLCVRLREWFLAMVTFGVPVIMTSLTVTDLRPFKGEGTFLNLINSAILGFTNLQKNLGGHDGLFPQKLISKAGGSWLSGILTRLTGTSISDRLAVSIFGYYTILILCLLTIAAVYFVMRSKLGIAFASIREDELEAKILGVNTTKYKLIAFVVSTFIAGIAGALLAHHIRYVSPTVYATQNSFDPIIYSVIGGLGTIEGPIIGTVAITLLNEFLKNLGLTYLKDVVIGAILVLTLLFVPKGISQIFEKLGIS